MKFVKPAILNLGKSESVIKGECSWGIENITLDKTGSYETYRRQIVHCGWLPGFVEVFCCKTVEACSTESNHC